MSGSRSPRAAEAFSRPPRLFDDAAMRGAQHQADLRRLATLLDRPACFLEKERLDSSGDARPGPAASYRLRASGRRLVLRHRSRDVGVLDEIFGRRYYEFPSPVSEALDRLSRPVRAVDVGANIGLFGLFLLERHPTATIKAFEPDRANAALHEQVIRENGLEDAWHLIRACAWNADGMLPFVEGEYCGSRVAESGEHPRTRHAPAIDIFPLLAEADLLKLDAEGGEWPIVTDPRLPDTPLRVIALEYHPELSPGGDPGSTAERLLAAAGFATDRIFEQPGGVGMLWAWREEGGDTALAGEHPEARRAGASGKRTSALSWR